MQGVAGATPDGRVYVVTPQAMAVEGPPESGEVVEEADGQPRSVTDMVEQPAKVMRIGNMIRQLLDEVKAAPLDDASRQRLRTIHSAVDRRAEGGLAPELVEELERSRCRSPTTRRPSDAELRSPRPSWSAGWRAVPRHPDRAVRPADGRPGPAGADAPRAAAGRGRDDAAGRPGGPPQRRQRRIVRVRAQTWSRALSQICPGGTE
jgi:hypothetical protein